MDKSKMTKLERYTLKLPNSNPVTVVYLGCDYGGAFFRDRAIVEHESVPGATLAVPFEYLSEIENASQS